MARIHLGLYRGANGTGPVKSKKTDTPPAPVGMTAEKAPAAPKRKAWRAGELRFQREAHGKPSFVPLLGMIDPLTKS